MRRALASAAAALGALALPAAAHACAVCSVLGNERSRRAFFDTTIFLSLVPLAVMAWGVFWLARRGGAALHAEFRESPDAVAEPGPESQPS